MRLLKSFDFSCLSTSFLRSLSLLFVSFLFVLRVTGHSFLTRTLSWFAEVSHRVLLTFKRPNQNKLQMQFKWIIFVKKISSKTVDLTKLCVDLRVKYTKKRTEYLKTILKISNVYDWFVTTIGQRSRNLCVESFWRNKIKKMRKISVINLLVTMIDPFKIGRNYIVKPIFNLASNLYEETLEKTKNGVLSVRDIILRVIILLMAIVIILWTAGFMYVVSSLIKIRLEHDIKGQYLTAFNH